MGKRSNFERVERDFYKTPYEAVIPLLPFLKPGTRFCEPCAGNGALMDHLTKNGHICARAWDIEPQREDIDKQDALTRLIGNIDCFITNPPWTRKILHPLITHLSAQHRTWLLADAAWAYTKQSAPFMPLLKMIVAVGRVKWIPDSKFTGKDDAAWYCFDAIGPQKTFFIGR